MASEFCPAVCPGPRTCNPYSTHASRTLPGGEGGSVTFSCALSGRDSTPLLLPTQRSLLGGKIHAYPLRVLSLVEETYFPKGTSSGLGGPSSVGEMTPRGETVSGRCREGFGEALWGTRAECPVGWDEVSPSPATPVAPDPRCPVPWSRRWL